MHHTFSTSASALIFLSFASSIRAGLLPALQPRAPLTCVDDDYLIALETAVPSFDATPFCSSWLGISDSTSYYSTVTPRTTVYASTSIIATTTEIDTSYDATVTVTATSVAFVPKHKRDAAPAPTKRASLNDIVPVVAPRADSSAVDSIVSGLSSACSCLRLTPGVIYSISTLNTTATRTEDVDVYDTATVTSTTDGGTTTVTVVATNTEHLSTILTNTTTTMSATPTATLVSSSTVGSNTTSTATSATTTPSSTMCPGINGTRINSSQTCKQYVAECFTNYPVTDDYHGLSTAAKTPADCAATCDSASECVGFVFEAPMDGQYNCFGLASLDGPFQSSPVANVVTYAMVNSTDPSCLPNTTSSVTMSSTMSSNLSTTVTSMPSVTPTNSLNSTSMTRLLNSTHTPHHKHNKTSTISASPTNSMNSTTTASMMPTNSMNSTSSCPAQVTVTQDNTITLLQTISVTLTEVETSYLPKAKATKHRRHYGSKY